MNRHRSLQKGPPRVEIRGSKSPTPLSTGISGHYGLRVFKRLLPFQWFSVQLSVPSSLRVLRRLKSQCSPAASRQVGMRRLRLTKLRKFDVFTSEALVNLETAVGRSPKARIAAIRATFPSSRRRLFAHRLSELDSNCSAVEE